MMEMELGDPRMEDPAVLEEEPQPEPTTVDEELAAMTAIVDALGSLDDGARNRVMHWANDRFHPVRFR